MHTMPIERRGISSSRLIYGCMGLDRQDMDAASRALEVACEIGITMFDHADIYRAGRAEAAFGEWLKGRPGRREEMVIQSKCGIRPPRYDFSKTHILESVDGSLQRLGTPYLDILLLHRPDPLMEPEEVAEAFTALQSSGKVRYFGVSNMNAAQMRFLQAALPDQLVVNQLEMSLARLDWVDEVVHTNQRAGARVHFSEGLLEHCRLEDVQIQAWGPLVNGLFSGRALEDQPEHIRKTADAVRELAEAKGVAPESIVLGWLMRHPAMIQPVIGTTHPDRIRACRDAARVAADLTREEWYALYVSARGAPLP